MICSAHVIIIVFRACAWGLRTPQALQGLKCVLQLEAHTANEALVAAQEELSKVSAQHEEVCARDRSPVAVPWTELLCAVVHLQHW